MARYEVEEGGKKKFFEIELDGTTCTTRWGNVGAPPTQAVKHLASEAEAQKLYDKQVKERTKRGYVEIGGAVAQAVADAKPLPPKELATHLKNIAKAPEDPAAYLVFADWLQSLGNPWGQLITIQHAASAESSKRKAADLELEAKKLLNADAVGIGALEKEGLKVTWRWGFFASASVPGNSSKGLLDNVKKLLKLPAAATLSELILDAQPVSMTTHRDWDNSPDNIVEIWDKVLSSLPKSSIPKRVSLGASPPVGGTAYVRMPDFGAVSEALGDVEHLCVAGCARDKSRPFDLPEAKTLEVRFAEAQQAGIAALMKSKLPKLERLSVWLGGTANCILDEVHEPAEIDYDDESDDYDEDQERYPATYPPSDLEKMSVYDSAVRGMGERLRPLLSGKLPKNVKELGLQSAHIDEELAAAIVDAPVLANLERLDLTRGYVSEEGAKVLAKGKKKLAHLQQIDLQGTKIAEKGIEVLKKALPNALLDKKQKDASHPDFLMRYVATME